MTGDAGMQRQKEATADDHHCLYHAIQLLLSHSLTGIFSGAGLPVALSGVSGVQLKHVLSNYSIHEWLSKSSSWAIVLNTTLILYNEQLNNRKRTWATRFRQYTWVAGSWCIEQEEEDSTHHDAWTCMISSLCFILTVICHRKQSAVLCSKFAVGLRQEWRLM